MGKLLTNEWLRADGEKWRNREVMVRFFDNTYGIAVWDGFEWRTQGGDKVHETVGHFITHFYIFERFNEHES